METEEELFAGFGSTNELSSETVAVFVIVWPAKRESTVAAMVRVAVAFGPSVPIVQLPVDISYVPTEAEAFTKLNPVGKMSCAFTMDDVAGPSAETVMV